MRKKKRRNLDTLPFISIVLGNKKYKVIKWGETVKGQSHIIVKRIMICSKYDNPDHYSEPKEFRMCYPIRETHAKLSILK